MEKEIKQGNEKEHEVGICQGCFQWQVVENGTMVLHGYRRSGLGYSIGQCAGAYEKPLQFSCDLVKSLVASDNVTNHYKHFAEGFLKNWKVKPLKSEIPRKSENVTYPGLSRVASKLIRDFAESVEAEYCEKEINEALKALGYDIESVKELWEVKWYSIQYRITKKFKPNEPKCYGDCGFGYYTIDQSGIESVSKEGVDYAVSLCRQHGLIQMDKPNADKLRVGTIVYDTYVIEDRNRLYEDDNKGKKPFYEAVFNNLYLVSNLSHCNSLSNHSVVDSEFLADAYKQDLSFRANAFITKFENG